MTATLLAASSTPTAGDTTEPLPWEKDAVPETATHLELGTVTNPALRDVLTYLAREDEPLLRISETIPGAVVLRRAMNRSVDQRIRLLVSGNAAELRPHLQVLRWLSSTEGELLQTSDVWLEDQSDAVQEGSNAGAEAEANVPTRATDVIEVVEWLATELGVPDGDIIAGAKIKRRNWHNWKNGSSPRLETQGQLWALLNSIRALSDMFEGGSAAWFKEGGSDRRALLTSGRHRALVQQALKEASQRGELSNAARRRRRRKSAAGFFE